MAYVYQHVRLDKNEVFYIGITTKIHPKRAKEKVNRNKIWRNIVAKTEYRIDILHKDISKEDACRIEKELILLHGRIHLGTGTLANITNGGEGISGYNFTEEEKDKMSKSHIGKVHSQETKDKIADHQKNIIWNDDKRKQMSDRLLNNHHSRGKNISPEHRQRISDGQKARYNKKKMN